MIFREEKYVYINGTKVSKNGFKSLSFETSKYSGSFSASRGFGSFTNEKNLNQIDVFNVEFIVTQDELPTFAKTYAQFKAFGVLPIENEYILNKIKNTLAYEKSLINLKTEKDSRAKNLREITHINVFLERIQIRSLERTSNGYQINMTLSLNRFGFSQSEFEKFRTKFKEWDELNGFTDICNKGIANSDFGDIQLEYIAIEKLNAKQKNGILMQMKNEIYSDDTADEFIDRNIIREENLKIHDSLNTTTKIKIPSKNIIQLELISHNNISNLPLYGEPIGLKSFMGVDSSTFIAKMIFDENDSATLDELKSISDKDTTKTIMNIKNMLPNMFDFNSASINKIYFHNTEEANGVVVTIIFEINSYFYDLSRLMNISNSGDKDIETTINSTLSIQENEKLNNVSLNNLKTTSFWLETTAQQFFLEKNIANSTIKSFLKTPVESDSQDEKGNTLSSLDSFENAVFTTFTMEDFLKSYTSYISRIDDKSFVDTLEGFNTYLNLKTPTLEQALEDNKEVELDQELDYDTLPLHRFKNYLNRTIFKEVFAQDLLNSSNFYNYFDGISVIKFFGSDFAKKHMIGYFNGEYESFNSFDQFAGKVVHEVFNTNNSRENLMALNMKKFFYASYLSNLYEIINSKVIEEEELITSNGINFKKVKNKIDSLYKYNVDNFFASIDRLPLFEESVSYVIEEMRKDISENEENLKESEDVSVYQVNKEILEPYYDIFIREFKNNKDFSMKENQNIAYNIFLTKLNYTLSKDYERIDFKNSANLNKFINSLLLSSSLMSLFLVDVTGMTSHFGFISKDISNNIGYKLNAFLYIGEHKKGKEETINKTFNKFKVNSHFEDELEFSPWIKASNTDKISKDYNFFYGHKINISSFGIFEDSQNNNNSILIDQTITDFITKKKKEFIDSSGDNTEKIEEIITPSTYPTSNEFNYFEKINGKPHINKRMKKRIIGNLDPFNVIEKVKNIICSMEQEAIPDYRVIIGNTDNNNNKGVFLNENVINYLELTNIAEIKISKNPQNKIKNANIIMLDFNKQLVNLDNRNTSISVKGKKDGQIEIYDITLGDNIIIELGYGDNRKTVFNGYVSSINNNGNIIEINSSGYASSLYTTVLKNVDFSSDILKKILNLSWKGAKSLLSQTDTGEPLMTGDIYSKFNSRANLNEHLFEFIQEGDLKKAVNYSIPEQSGFEGSMFIIFTKLLALLPKNVKNVIGGYTKSSGTSVLLKRILEENKMSNAFTKTGEITSINGNSNIYRNIFNVDVDYETYGIVTLDTNQGELLEKEFKIETSDDAYFDTYIKNKEVNTLNQYYSTVNTKVDLNVNIKAEVDEDSDPNEETVPSPIPDTTNSFFFPTNSKRITSPFSARRFHPIKKKYTQHKGIDIGSSKPGVLSHRDYIYSSKEGIIETSFYSKSGGQMIVINHGNNEKTRYLHLDDRFVKVGQKVSKGQKIGLMGNTGQSAGKHLHFEILISNIAKDPMLYFKEGDNV